MMRNSLNKYISIETLFFILLRFTGREQFIAKNVLYECTAVFALDERKSSFS